MDIEFIFRNFWIFFIFVTILNALILKVRSGKYIKESPQLEEGYNKFFRGILIYGNIPWVIMGVGNLTNITNNIFQYFYPRSLNPMVLIFHTSILFIWVSGAIWIYKKQGAAFIEQHPGFFKSNGLGGSKDLTAKQVKTFYPIMILGGVIAMAMMWVGFFPEI